MSQTLHRQPDDHRRLFKSDRKAYERAYYSQNKAAIAEKKRAYYSQNKEKLKWQQIKRRDQRQQERRLSFA